MELKLITDPKYLNILNELKKLEQIFLQPGFGISIKDLENMIDNSFWEIGASGKQYTREQALEVLHERLKNPIDEKWSTEDFYCMEIAQGNFMLAYTLHQKERTTRRASIWRRYGNDWKIVFHQGTIVEDL